MIVNDPVFGFIEVEKGLLTQLLRHPVMTRLTRIKQLGPSHYVYPGALHTRFAHSLGAMHLTGEAVRSLREKGVKISEEEREGVEAAMLLHDVGHGPMSHTLEGEIMSGIRHEEVSLLLMKRLDRELGGRLGPAIEIYRDGYGRRFLHELICSQIDMDRLDYLCRDSFFTGVREGNIGVGRIIKMLDVSDDRLVVKKKGIYTIENYLMARRLMYWQVYYHKTVMAASEILRLSLRRAKELARRGAAPECPGALKYFVVNDVDEAWRKEHGEWLDYYLALDDSDVLMAMKAWLGADDKILRLLAGDYIKRRLLKATELRQPCGEDELRRRRLEMAKKAGVTEEEASYLVVYREIDQMLYSRHANQIKFLLAAGQVEAIDAFSELLATSFTDSPSRRYFVFSHRTDS